jgi:hypothetical protein
MGFGNEVGVWVAHSFRILFDIAVPMVSAFCLRLYNLELYRRVMGGKLGLLAINRSGWCRIEEDWVDIGLMGVIYVH